MYLYINIYVHVYKHTRTHAHAHTHTHAQRQSLTPPTCTHTDWEMPDASFRLGQGVAKLYTLQKTDTAHEL